MSIFDYLDKNKEWLFSGGGVVVLGVIVAAFRNRVFPRKKTSTTAVVATDLDQPQKLSELSTYESAQATKTHSGELSEIISTIKKSPSLQQSDVIKHYIGIKVQWEALLFKAEKKDEENVRVVLDFGSKSLHLVYCSVRLSDYRELGVLEQGAPVTVIGRISELSTSSASLEEVQLFFHSMSPSRDA